MFFIFEINIAVCNNIRISMSSNFINFIYFFIISYTQPVDCWLKDETSACNWVIQLFNFCSNDKFYWLLLSLNTELIYNTECQVALWIHSDECRFFSTQHWSLRFYIVRMPSPQHGAWPLVLLTETVQGNKQSWEILLNPSRRNFSY